VTGPQRLHLARRIAVGVLALGLVWVLGVWPPPLWWRSHWPTQTAMMRIRGGGATYQPTPLGGFPATLRRMVLIGEDSRFSTHHGVDLQEIREALGLDQNAGLRPTLKRIWERRDRIRGASTITQQLAKNLYLSPTRNPLRKVKEVVTALRLEAALPKDRILDLYLNLVELGPGVWGMPAASERYFGVPPTALTESQAAALAATLPFPLSSNPTYRPDRMSRRRDLILARFHGVDVYIPPGELEEVLESLPVPDRLPALPVIPPAVPASADSTKPDTTPLPRDSGARDSVTDSMRGVALPASRQSTSRRGITRAR
jgi:monofunctional biosynthetic peptidoglycan transglycosylase